MNLYGPVLRIETRQPVHRVVALATLLAVLCFGLDAFAQDDKKKDEPKKDNVIKPENADPNEKYNLPPNFDPNFKPKKTPKNQKVTLDFRQAQLDEVVKMFSSVMEKNFIISDSVNTSKTITIISPKPVPLNEAYRAFLAALQMNGLTVVPFGKFLKIVESSKAIQEPLSPYGENERLPNEARMVTAIIPVENAGVDEIQGVISKFVTPEATIIPYGSSLIITENGSNLRRLQKLVKKLDQGDSASKVYVYKVLYSDATEVAAKLEEIFKKGTKTSSKSKSKKAESSEQLDVDITDIIPDERTNQLIIVSNRRSFEKIKKMIEILDVPTIAGGQIHVKFLEYSDAEELSQTLSQLAGGNNNRNNRANQNRNVRANSGNQANAQVGSVAELLSGEVQITAHPPSNALVVIASPRDYLSLENVINLLDRPRKQVYVEAVIMEIGMDTDRQVDIGFGAGTAADLDGVLPDSLVEDGLISDTNGLLVGQSNNPGLGAIDSTLGLIGPILTIPGTSISLPAFVLALNATQRDVATNILSTPSIMTLNNEEAEIQVGQRIRFRTSPLGGGGNLSSLISQGAQDAGLGNIGSLGGLGLLGGAVETADIGITLRITPQVNESQYVRLEVDQEVTDILGAIEPGEAPNETRRNIKTIVMVKDQATVAIGGLIRDVDNETINKVPFLGDIPVLGVLFRSTGTIKTKQNLVLMLTPYIIESDADLKKIRERKMAEREELLKLFGRRDIAYMKTVNFDRKSGLLDKMKRQIYDAINEKNARDEAIKAFDQNGPQYRILGDDEERIQREKLEDGGIRFDPEVE